LNPGTSVFDTSLLHAAALNAALAFAAHRLGTVRTGGAVSGALLGSVVLLFGGWGPFALLGFFFALGSGATRLGWSAKRRRGVAEAHGGARGAGEVFANGGVAAALALAYGLGGWQAALVGYAGALAAVAADTVSSEIGQAYGSRPRSPLTLRPARVGAPGAVSAAGTAAGAGASLVMALAALGLGVVPLFAVAPVAAGGVAAAAAESVLAAGTGGRAPHHALNTFDALAGAGIALALLGLV